MTKEARLVSKNLDEVLDELDQYSSTSRGSAPSKEIDKAARRLISAGENTLENAIALLNTETTNSIELALLILPLDSKENRNEIFDILIKYADHSNWEIREYAGERIGEFLRYNFRDYRKDLIRLRASDSENIRRAVVIGLKYLGKYRELSISQDILEILALYMDDESKYVKKNLGPFAIGDAMINYDSVGTLDLLKRYADSDNPNIKWNVASAFSTAAGAKHGDSGFYILTRLIHDSNKSVRQMALTGLKNLYKRNDSKRDEIRKFLYSIMNTVDLPQKNFSFLES